MNRKFYHDYLARNRECLHQLPMERFNELVEFVKSLPDRLHKTVSGNHFLFVGRYGAQKIGDYVEQFDKEIQKIEKEINAFLR